MTLKQNLINLEIIFKKLNQIFEKKIIRKNELEKNQVELDSFYKKKEEISFYLDILNNLNIHEDEKNVVDKLLLLQIKFGSCSTRVDFSHSLLKKIILTTDKIYKKKLLKKNIVALHSSDKNDKKIRLLDTYNLLMRLNDLKKGEALESQYARRLYKYIDRYQVCQEKMFLYATKINELEFIDKDLLINYLMNINLYLTESLVILEFFEDSIRDVYEKYVSDYFKKNKVKQIVFEN